MAECVQAAYWVDISGPLGKKKCLFLPLYQWRRSGAVEDEDDELSVPESKVSFYARQHGFTSSPSIKVLSNQLFKLFFIKASSQKNAEQMFNGSIAIGALAEIQFQDSAGRKVIGSKSGYMGAEVVGGDQARVLCEVAFKDLTFEGGEDLFLVLTGDPLADEALENHTIIFFSHEFKESGRLGNKRARTEEDESGAVERFCLEYMGDAPKGKRGKK